MTYELHLGDCLEILPTLPDSSVDAIIADLPYGTTACKWDSIIPLDKLWAEYKRVIKPRGAIVLFGSQPFTSQLVMSNPQWFKYQWVWDKKAHANFASAQYQPLKVHEDICVFSKGSHRYNPIKTIGPPNHSGQLKPGKRQFMFGRIEGATQDLSGMKYPTSIICFPKYSSRHKLHPTQKPTPLLEYLVKTYTNEGDIILDNTMGSGTTGVACLNTGRNFIGMEKELPYYDIASNRLSSVSESCSKY